MNSSRNGYLSSPSVAFALVGVAAVAWLAWSAVQTGTDPHDPGAKSRPVDTRIDLGPAERAQIELFRNASPSVAHITTRTLTVDRFSMRATEVPSGTGSGFVWDDHGYIVTNFHVVANARSALVTLDTQEVYEADLVGGDPSYDIAVLHIPPGSASLKPIAIGTSKDLLVGQETFAIGNPFGLDHTLSTGVVSGLDREINAPDGSVIRGVIQTDAAINPGNSGGPLLDSAGRLIGMNTAIASPSGANSGIGFAVPVDTINRIVPRLIRGQRTNMPILGIRAAPAEVARALDVDGVVVGDVEQGLGADTAGLRPMQVDGRGRAVGFDAITRVGGIPVHSLGDLHEVLSHYEAGDMVDVDILRDGKESQVQVRLSGGT
jgi:S1-C subfamily serine protease